MEKKLKTSYYAKLNKIDLSKFQPVAISRDEGKLVGFDGRAMKKLSPFTFFKKWKETEEALNLDFKHKIMSENLYLKLKSENQRSYIEKFYDNVLSKLAPQEIYDELGENAVLLCFEKPTEFCHRFLVAGWLEMNLGIEIAEYGFENDEKVKKNKENLKFLLKEDRKSVV